MARVLILAGTSEAARLSRTLVREGRHDVVLSLAGRTSAPPPTGARLRIGGFGGAAGLAEYLAANAIEAVIDATHPFANTISRNAARACAELGVARIALDRPPWQAQPGDRWVPARDEADAAAQLPPQSRAFLALGRQRLKSFQIRNDIWYLIRVVDPPPEPLLKAPHHVIVARGPFALADELDVLDRHAITHVVARNSGGAGARAKLDAARARTLPVIIIDRPAPPPAPTAPDVPALHAWLMTTLR